MTADPRTPPAAAPLDDGASRPITLAEMWNAAEIERNAFGVRLVQAVACSLDATQSGAARADANRVAGRRLRSVRVFEKIMALIDDAGDPEILQRRIEIAREKRAAEQAEVDEVDGHDGA